MRYLIITILAVVMLIPAWGWAGELENTHDFPNGCQVMDQMKVCDGYDLNDIQYVISKKEYLCYLRMREAMRLMDKVYYNTPMIDLPKTDLARRLNAEWTSTYQDCVEGQ